MITSIAKGLLRGSGKIFGKTAIGLGKGALHGASFASRYPAWYIRRWMKLGLRDKIANIGNLGMFYKRNKRRWHDAMHAGELIHPYSYM